MYLIRIFVLIFSILFIACDNKSTGLDDEKVFNLESSTLENLRLKRTKDGFFIEGEEDKIILFDIFATYCPPCKVEAKDLSYIQKIYSKDLKIIALSIEKNIDNEKLNKFAKDYKANYFMSISEDVDEIIKIILADIKYENTLYIPFKVIVKNGKYKNLSNSYEDSSNYYYIGQTYPEMLKTDIDNIIQEAK